MPTSGMPMPDLSANLRTVSTIQASSALAGWLMIFTPMLILAMDLLISSEMMAPEKPTTSEKIISCPVLVPV